MVKVELLTPEREDEYTEFVSKQETAMFNSSLKFRRLIEWLTGAVPKYLIAIEDNSIVGVLPSFITLGKYGAVLNSMPWYGSNPGVLGLYKEELLEAFYDVASEYNVISSTFISSPFEDTTWYDKNLEVTHEDQRYGTIKELPEYSNNIEQDLMDSIHSKTRNLIRKGRKMNCVEDTPYPSYRNYVVDLHRANMEALGAPYKSKAFIDEMAYVLTYGVDYRVYVATRANTNYTLSAGLILKYFSRTVDYMTPAVDVNYRSEQPLDAIIFEAMIEASRLGYKYWNWGGTAIKGMEGVLHFKRRWSIKNCINSIYKYYTNVRYSRIESLPKEEVLGEYPYFYVIPFK